MCKTIRVEMFDVKVFDFILITNNAPPRKKNQCL